MSARGALTCDHDEQTTREKTRHLISLRALVFIPFPLPFYTLRSSALLAFEFFPCGDFFISARRTAQIPPFLPVLSSLLPLLLRTMHSGAPSKRLKRIHTAGLCSTRKDRLARWYGWVFSFYLSEMNFRLLLHTVLFIKAMEYMHAHDCFSGQCGNFTLLYSTYQ